MVTISGDHVPNLVVVQSTCENCSNVTRVKPNSKCKVCGNQCKKCNKWNKEHTAFKVILAQDVEIEKSYFMDKIQSRHFVHGCSLNSMPMLLSLLIMLEYMMHISNTIIYLYRVLLLK